VGVPSGVAGNTGTQMLWRAAWAAASFSGGATSCMCAPMHVSDGSGNAPASTGGVVAMPWYLPVSCPACVWRPFLTLVGGEPRRRAFGHGGGCLAPARRCSLVRLHAARPLAWSLWREFVSISLYRCAAPRRWQPLNVHTYTYCAVSLCVSAPFFDSLSSLCSVEGRDPAFLHGARAG